MDLPGRRATNPAVSIIVPARNEEASLGRCLESLVSQEKIDFEIIVVDDGSTDRTREIAQSFPGVRVIDAEPLQRNWTGKNNAVFTGATQARALWLLFTDADTVHSVDSLAHAVAEAQFNGVSLLSYSPKQEVHGFWENALMPVIFAELASMYRPSEVSNPASPVAAANGQYLLIAREAYDAVGGHAAVAGSLLEDVDLARVVKARGYKIHFRYAGDAVHTRMYRTFAQLREGWTKNLALLFPSSGKLAILRLAEFTIIAGASVAAGVLAVRGSSVLAFGWAGIAVLSFARFLLRIRKAHFAWDASALSIFGLPMFSYLLLRSRSAHRRGAVTWKARTYNPNAGVNTAHLGAGVPHPQPGKARQIPSLKPIQ